MAIAIAIISIQRHRVSQEIVRDNGARHDIPSALASVNPQKDTLADAAEMRYSFQMAKPMIDLDVFYRNLLGMDRAEVRKSAMSYLQISGLNAFIDDLVVPVLDRLGKEWESGNVALAEIYMGGKLCEELIEDALNTATESMNRTSLRVGVVLLHDFHVLGKRLLISVLKSAGFQVIDYGTQEVLHLLDLIRSNPPDAMMISTLMLNSALRVREVIDALRKENIATRVFVGGAPFRFDSELWREVHADGMGKTASDCISLLDTFFPTHSPTVDSSSILALQGSSDAGKASQIDVTDNSEKRWT